ncbi:hypothetical protein [Thiothrix litoralis]|uniref:hypothetical protein n=1 Tax=Thiothrix litoralis TaxID=2891210 RepID=UPI003C730B52
MQSLKIIRQQDTHYRQTFWRALQQITPQHHARREQRQQTLGSHPFQHKHSS